MFSHKATSSGAGRKESTLATQPCYEMGDYPCHGGQTWKKWQKPQAELEEMFSQMAEFFYQKNI